MDLNEIQSLIKFVSKSGASEVELETKDFKIVIKTDSRKKSDEITQVVHAPMPMPQQVVTAPAPAQAAPASVSVTENKADDSKYITIKSPMIGTFYRSSAPDKPSFVEVGSDIKNGSVLCIIEAMKLFNEIEAEVSGKIVKVLVDDATPVEYDQPLFLVEPA
jgi:acetyl-CoA carboxylase biotin carboxyl carrier protein